MASISYSYGDTYNSSKSKSFDISYVYTDPQSGYITSFGSRTIGNETLYDLGIQNSNTGNAIASYVGSDTTISVREDFTSNTGDVSLQGGNGASTLLGGSGNDTLLGGARADVLDGGGGINTASYATSSAGVTVNLNLAPGTAQVGGGDASGDMLTNIQNVIGSAYADILIGNTGNSLQGGGGDDTLRIQGTPTLVDGGAGNNTLSVTRTASLDDSNFANIEKVVAYGGANLDMSGVSARSTPALIRSQSTAGSKATITGTQGADTIAGGAGADILNGYLGNDVITTGSGNATIVGGTKTGVSDGNDVIFAGSGNLTFQDFMAGLGHDVIRGAATNISNDTFEFGDSFGRSLADLAFTPSGPMSGNTVITGLGGPQGDSITLVGVSVEQAHSAKYLFAGQSL